MGTSEHELTPEQRTRRAAELHVRGPALFVQLLAPSFGSREGTEVGEHVRDKLQGSTDIIRVVVLDFGEVDFVDSGGLGAVIMIKDEAKRIADATVVIFGLRSDLRQILALTKLDRVLKIVDTADDLSQIISARG